jgi:hypothetical protein
MFAMACTGTSNKTTKHPMPNLGNMPSPHAAAERAHAYAVATGTDRTSKGRKIPFQRVCSKDFCVNQCSYPESASQMTALPQPPDDECLRGCLFQSGCNGSNLGPNFDPRKAVDGESRRYGQPFDPAWRPPTTSR